MNTDPTPAPPGQLEFPPTFTMYSYGPAKPYVPKEDSAMSDDPTPAPAAGMSEAPATLDEMLVVLRRRPDVRWSVNPDDFDCDRCFTAGDIADAIEALRAEAARAGEKLPRDRNGALILPGDHVTRGDGIVGWVQHTDTSLRVVAQFPSCAYPLTIPGKNLTLSPGRGGVANKDAGTD